MTSNKKVFLYNSSNNLPKEGWLQRCSLCNEITGNTMDVVKIYIPREKKHLEYIVYVCLKCENKVIYVDNIKQQFLKLIDNTIKNYLDIRNIYSYSIDNNVANTSFNHKQLTHYLTSQLNQTLRCLSRCRPTHQPVQHEKTAPNQEHTPEKAGRP